MYKISIIIPVFNVEDTLQKAFDSIFNQSIGFKNLEVIFIDDNSSDRSADIIRELSDKHDNVKSFYLDENSGFAGKPRNIGIENATADYLMFLDPDDIYLKDACEILYKNITENHLELVSGNYNINRNSQTVLNNWNIIKTNDGESVEIQTIDENFNFLLTTPSVWSKIFKKEFILKNNIEFLEGVPAQDLVFVSEALLKANGIKFINTPVVEYIPRQSGDNTSVTSKKNKAVLAGFIRSYSKVYEIAEEYNKDYAWIGPRNLFFWIKQFSLSDLKINDKIDLLYMATSLFEEFIKSDRINPPKFLKEFLEMIEKKDYLNAARLSEKLDIFYDDNILTEIIKDKKIILLFYGLDIEIGGLAKATFNRANILMQKGYAVRILNVDESKNFDYIIENFHKNEYLDNTIKLTNILEYYSEKNTFDDNSKYKHNINEPFSEKIENNDKSTEINHYRDSVKETLIKSETYFNKYSCIKTYDWENNLEYEEFFTKDGFNYLNIQHENYNKIYILNDRKTNLKLKFKDMFEFHTYFITEILLDYTNKPFLVNENSGRIPNFNGVDNNLAYKIASIHTNPYSDEHHYGSHLRNDFSILENVNDLDYIVVLTEALKRDLVKEFNLENINAIPNILNMSEYTSDESYSREKNKFSIFARLSPEKNISEAIKSFEIVVRNRKDAILEIYGRAVTPSELIEEKKLKELVSELRLEENVIFKGHAENVNEKMSESLATLFVSNFEGLGMVVLESMVNSTPVISYDINYGPSDFIKHEKNGFLVKQHDINGLAKYMLLLLENPEKSDEMGKIAHEDILKKIKPEILIEKWENTFKEVYVNSRNEEMKIYDKLDSNVLNELKQQEKIRIKLYRKNDKLSRQNRLLKRQIEAKNTSKIKKMFKKIKSKK